MVEEKIMNFNKQKLISGTITSIALLTVGAISLHFTGLTYGLGVGFVLGAFAFDKVDALVLKKVSKEK